MNDIVSPVQSISYTNKDFVSVYEELLDLTKELTSQWDPSISNESDPGVILLKLNAVIADKCNYAIDKNTLECFPLSVTQEANARQLFEQLGYYMHWYKAAETNVFIKWIGETSQNTINIPKFTMVTDNNENTIYTLIGPATESITGQYNVSDQTLYCNDSEGITFKALQGIAVNYDINGDTLITVANLDNNNRLYFPTTDIAENGIFIKNASEENYMAWVKKDNLLVENLGNTYYKFDVVRDGSACYIEFPEDVESIFKDGINITYIRTNGELGNISSQYISKFYNFNTVITNDEAIILDSNNILISNYQSGLGGSSTEDINAAYKGYKRTVGTFNTLVTLRDYINYINNSDLVSNCFVCDRTNDIQLTYKIMTSINDVDQTITKIEADSGLNAYSLKLYLLTKVEDINAATYNKTFNLIGSDGQNIVKNYIENSQTINHEFLNLADPTGYNPHICLFKNKCPIDCTIITQSALTDAQMNEMKSNIVTALCDTFNAKEVEFGEKFPYDLVYKTILNADNRIKNVSLGNINYTTYAVYQDSNRKLTYVTVDGTNKWLNDEWEEESPLSYGLNPRNPVVGATVSLPPVYKDVNISDEDDNFYFCSSNKELSATCDIDTYMYFYGSDQEVFPGNCYELNKIECTASSPLTWKLVMPDGSLGSTFDPSSAGITISGTVDVGDICKFRLSYAHQFRNDIYVKSVLAGVTQFYVKDESFDYKLNNRYVDLVNNVEKIWSNVTVSFDYDSRYGIDNTSYELKSNEALQFFNPHLINKDKYSNNVKFEYKISQDVPENTDYQLGNNEYIIFYWSESEDKVWQYASYGFGTIINPSFKLDAFTGTNAVADVASYNLLKYEDIGSGNYSYANKSSAKYGDISRNCNNAIKNLTSADNKLTGLKTIYIKEINQFTLNAQSNVGLYWVLKSSNNGMYVLFNEDETTRTLNDDELFIFTNPAFTSYTTLGSGTTLTRQNTGTIWQVPIIPANEIALNGLLALQDSYFTIPVTDELLCTENVFTTLGSGTIIEIETPGNNSNVCTFNCTATPKSGSTLGIYGFDPSAWVENYSDYGIGTTDIVYNRSDSSWKLNGNTIDLEDYGIIITDSSDTSTITTPTLVNGDKITINQFLSYELVFTRDTCNIVVPNTSTDYRIGDYPTLSDFTFRYQLEDSVEYEYLNKVSLVNQLGFQARSLLSINMSPVKSQTLLDNQTIYYKVHGDDTEYYIDGEDATSENYASNIPATYPVSLLSSIDISSDGSSIIDSYVSETTSSGESVINYLSLYEFATVLNLPQAISLSTPQKIIFNSSGDVNFTFTPSDNDRTLTIALPVGEYIIGVKNYEQDLTSCYLAFDNTPLTQMFDRTSTDLSEGGVYYLYMPVANTNQHTLKMHIEGHTADCAIQLTNCYKYEYPENVNHNYVESWIRYLDTNNDFKYLYEVPASKLIENPLDSQEFFNINHIYNSYTIGQLDTIKIK